MTIDQAVAKVSAEIDVLLQQRMDDIACQMIANGADLNRPPAPPDPDADWQPVSFDEVLQRQRAIDDLWKTEAITQIRKSLEAEYLQRRAPRWPTKLMPAVSAAKWLRTVATGAMSGIRTLPRLRI